MSTTRKPSKGVSCHRRDGYVRDVLKIEIADAPRDAGVGIHDGVRRLVCIWHVLLFCYFAILMVDFLNDSRLARLARLAWPLNVMSCQIFVDVVVLLSSCVVCVCCRAENNKI